MKKVNKSTNVVSCIAFEKFLKSCYYTRCCHEQGLISPAGGPTINTGHGHGDCVEGIRKMLLSEQGLFHGKSAISTCIRERIRLGPFPNWYG